MTRNPIQLMLLALVAGILMPASLLANMASPLLRGSGTGLPFVSTHATVRHETLKITPSADFKTCKFDVVYDIFADTSGLRIPLLFIAERYGSDMKIWVDGHEVEVRHLPEKFFYRQVSPLSHFLGMQDDSLQEFTVFEIEWEKGQPTHYNQDECHYFETDLAAGAHQVRVAYVAEVWRDRHEWLEDAKFMYALDPASHWYAFGRLDVTLDASVAPFAVTTNLGPPDSGDIAQVAVWHFDQLPDLKVIEILSVPTVSGFGQAMIDFGMEGFMWLSGGLLALLHLVWMWRWHKKRTQKKFHWAWLWGSLAVPFLAMVVFCASYNWINAAIGPSASHYGGYYFLIFIFYPVAAIGYGLLMSLVDYLLRRKYRMQRA